MTNRILLYVHFNKENELADYVPYQLEKLGPIFDRVFFVSNSVLSEKDLRSLQEAKLIDDFLQRNNEGYDFKAWSDAMHEIGFDQLAEYDSVTLMNDTCFGPVFDFKTVFEKMDEDESIDFWGITNNRSHEVKPWENKEAIILPDHIQSYFVSYKKNLVKSEKFKEFWSNIELLKDVVEVIIRYETAMTEHFEKAGFRSSVLFDTRNEPWGGMQIHDFSVFSLSELLKRRIPFFKVKAFSFGADDIYTPLVVEKIRSESDFPTELIIDHMTFVDYPDRDYMLYDKTVQVKDSLKVKASKEMSVGIHLHVFFEDLLDEFIESFDQYIGNYDLFITTDSEEKRERLLSRLSENKNLKELLVTGAVGRDILPWQKIHDKLTSYDIAGHFHTKKSAENAWIVGETWRKDLVDRLVKPANGLFEKFKENPKLGLIIPDIPDFFIFHHGPAFYNESRLTPHMEYLWEKLAYEDKSLKESRSYVMSCGTMLWYRPQALENILSMDFSDRIPKEPLPFDSILHAFERMLVYVAWANGYDFRISQAQSLNGFHALSSSNRMVYEAKTDPRFRHLMFNMRDQENQIPLGEILSLLGGKLKRMIKNFLRKIKRKLRIRKG